MLIKKSDISYIVQRQNPKTNKKQEIFVLGTAHVSKRSIEDVDKSIEEFKPDLVALELCKNRYDKLVFNNQWFNKDLFDIINNNEHLLFLLNITLSSYQRSIGEELGVMPGSEFLEANKVAKEKGINVALVDRDINVTMKRAFEKTSFWDKMKIFFAIIGSFLFSPAPKKEDIIEALKKEDMLNRALDEFGKFSKSLKTVLIDERNTYIANKTLALDSDKILLVVGAGHAKEIANILDKQKEPKDLKELELAEKKKNSNLIGWIILFGFLGLFLYALLAKGIGVAASMILWWILATGIPSALGALIGGASILAIIVAFCVAPFTTLHPLLAAGWFAGYIELKKEKPTVKDFFGLKEVKGFKDFRTNKVLKILLIVSLTNLGASIGTLVAFPLIIAYLI